MADDRDDVTREHTTVVETGGGGGGGVLAVVLLIIVVLVLLYVWLLRHPVGSAWRTQRTSTSQIRSTLTSTTADVAAMMQAGCESLLAFGRGSNRGRARLSLGP